MPVLKGIKTTSLAYLGLEIMLILPAFMKHPDKAVKAAIVGVTVPLLFYLITVVMVIGALSIDGVVTITWPTITLVRSYEEPGILFERYESLLLVIWIMQIFTTFNITHFMAALGLAQTFKTNIRPFIYGVLPIIFLITMFPKNINDVLKLGDQIGDIALCLFGLLPLLLLVISWIKEGKNGQKP